MIGSKRMLLGQSRIHLAYGVHNNQLGFAISSLCLIASGEIINDLNFASISYYLYSFRIYILCLFVAISSLRINILGHPFITNFCE